MRVQSSLREHLEDAGDLYDAVLLDIDGTLLRGSRAVDGAADLLGDLRRLKIPFVLLTNDGNHSPEEKSSVLRHVGVPVCAAEIVSCSEAIKDYVRENRMGRAQVFVMGDLGVPCHARRANLRPTRNLAALADCRAIIVGENNYDWESVINSIINQLIARPETVMLVPNPDSYWPGRTGRIEIGAGGIARLIQGILAEYGMPYNPVFLGKPNPAIYLRALHHLQEQHAVKLKIQPRRILAVGDNLRSDILGGNRMGFSTALVLTGVTAAHHLKQSLSRTLHPRLVFANL